MSINPDIETKCECVLDNYVKCPICEGNEIVIPDLDDGLDVTCLTCQGTGYISREKYNAMMKFALEE